MNKVKNKILIVSGVLIILFLVLLLIPKETKEFKSPPPQPKETPAKNILQNTTTPKVILEINGIRYESEISIPINIYDFMQKLKTEGKIDFKEKNYLGMGKLIEEINGIKNSGELNWIYYVNGKKANIGVSNYKINNGDIVSWKYEKGY